MNLTAEEVAPGDVVQITNPDHPWFPCLLLVTEVKSWGVQAGVLIPESNSENKIATAYNRLNFDEIEYVGRAPFQEDQTK
jgi:hypothetical protein